uniref:Gamma-interferon-inducible lysosomal thiol reductase n=1 Tax=Globodera pallida TaxID=36090 RepID=A0A183C7N5_GLOPA
MLSTPLFSQFFALLLPPLHIATLAQSSFIQIGVLFESLCPDSIDFILGPLSDAEAKFKQHIQLELVPFGKATIHENGEITCQHGKYECQINKFLMTFVPWILWNNGSNKEVQEESREDLKPFICGHLKKANIDQANCA